MKPYFAYGSNLWLPQMTDRCPQHRLIGPGRLPGYRWIIYSRGYANIIPSPEDYVLGLLYEIAPTDEATLDEFEGVHLDIYQKQTHLVETPSGPVSCMVYVDPIITPGTPRMEYAHRINAGIIDASLPSEYVEKYIRPYIPFT